MESGHPALGLSGALVTFGGEPFTGTLRVRIPALGQVHRNRYRRGLQHGRSTEELNDGTLLAERRYIGGVKHGIHRTWFPDGTPSTRAEYHLGRYIGSAWSWHDNGRVSDFTRYDAEGQVVATKRWRPTGEIYMNFVFHNGEAIGMPGSKVCDPIEKGRKKP